MTIENEKHQMPPAPKELPSPRKLLSHQPFLAKAFEYDLAGNPEVHTVETIDNEGKLTNKKYVEFHDTQAEHILNKSQLPLDKPFVVGEEEIRKVRNWLDRYKTAFPYIYEDVNIRGNNRNGINVLPDYDSINAKCTQVEELLAIDLSAE